MGRGELNVGAGGLCADHFVVLFSLLALFFCLASLIAASIDYFIIFNNKNICVPSLIFAEEEKSSTVYRMISYDII